MKHSRFSTKIIAAAAAILISSAALISCASTPADAPADATAREIVQMAQTAYDAGNTKAALNYYETLIMRYGSDMAVYVEGRYEIAHIYLKQKRYTDAADIYMEIIDIYSSLQPGTLPEAFKKLAQNDLSKIPASKLLKEEQ